MDVVEGSDYRLSQFPHNAQERTWALLVSVFSSLATFSVVLARFVDRLDERCDRLRNNFCVSEVEGGRWSGEERRR